MTLYLRAYRGCRRDARAFGGISIWLLFRCLPAFLLASILILLLFASQARALHRDADILNGGHLLLSGGNSHSVPALMQSGKVSIDISGMVATVRLQQTFRNTTDHFVEGTYAFPLPGNAAVRHMEMRLGQRRIVGKIREREEAKAIYTAAREAGKKASLLEQQRPNLFTNRVANIAPGEEVHVVLEYVQGVQFSAGLFSLRFPMTITPRFMPGKPLQAEPQVTQLQPGQQRIDTALQVNPDQGWADATDEVPDAPAISPLLHRAPGSDTRPINPITLDARLDMGMPLASVTSPYHDIVLARRAGVYDIRLAHGQSEMDRDFVLQWQPVSGAAPRAAMFTQQVGQEYFGLLMVVPPALANSALSMPRELVFVIDTSGSMSGVSIEQARLGLSQALSQLRPEDTFNVIAFDSTHRSLFRNSVPANRHHVAQAQEFVRLLQASGGTNMMPALQAALRSAGEADSHRAAPALRQLVFITDGAVGNEQALLDMITRQLGDTRLFTVGIGSAPNSWFMRRAAEFGRGTHTHIGDIDEVGSRIALLFQQLSQPAAVDLQIDWPQSVDAWPARLPDLYYGQPLSVAVNFGQSLPAGTVAVRGILGDVPWRTAMDLAGSVGDHDGVSSLWARRKLEGLLDLRYRNSDETEIKAEATALALQHSLLSPYTSFVAVEEVISRTAQDQLESAAVPNTRPRGQGDQLFAYPRTATTGAARAWFAALALFLALVVRLVRQGEVDHVAPEEA